MHRPQFTLKTLLWLMLVVGALFGGRQWGIRHQRQNKLDELVKEQERLVAAEKKPHDKYQLMFQMHLEELESLRPPRSPAVEAVYNLSNRHKVKLPQHLGVPLPDRIPGMHPMSSRRTWIRFFLTYRTREGLTLGWSTTHHIEIERSAFWSHVS